MQRLGHPVHRVVIRQARWRDARARASSTRAVGDNVPSDAVEWTCKSMLMGPSQPLCVMIS